MTRDRRSLALTIELELICLAVFSKYAAELHELEALDRVVEETSKGDDTNNKTGCL